MPGGGMGRAGGPRDPSHPLRLTERFRGVQVSLQTALGQPGGGMGKAAEICCLLDRDCKVRSPITSSGKQFSNAAEGTRPCPPIRDEAVVASDGGGLRMDRYHSH